MPLREFKLPEEDEEYLNSRKLDWDTVIDGQAKWLIVHGYPIPAGYWATMAHPTWPCVSSPPTRMTISIWLIFSRICRMGSRFRI